MDSERGGLRQQYAAIGCFDIHALTAPQDDLGCTCQLRNLATTSAGKAEHGAKRGDQLTPAHIHEPAGEANSHRPSRCSRYCGEQTPAPHSASAAFARNKRNSSRPIPRSLAASSALALERVSQTALETCASRVPEWLSKRMRSPSRTLPSGPPLRHSGDT